MSTLNLAPRVTLAEAADIIAAVGTTNPVLLRGEKGIGKSAVMSLLRDRLGSGYEYIYFDMASKDLGDIAMPSVNRERRVTEYFANAIFKLDMGKPLVILLDELGKAPKGVINMMHPLLEVNNRRLGDVPLPEGSIVIGTSNLSEEGLGDAIAEHTLDRMTCLEVSKPKPAEWLLWAAGNNIHPALMAWVNQTPTCLASFRDDDFEADNPYVYNPKRVQQKYVTPRSLELASNVIWGREKMSANALFASLYGQIGGSAARDIQAFIAFQDELPARELILAHPETTFIPQSAGAVITLLFNLERAVDKDNITAIMKYISRLEAEHQAVFCITMARSKAKQAVAFGSKAFADWTALNADIL